MVNAWMSLGSRSAVIVVLAVAPACSLAAPKPCEVVRDAVPLRGKFDGADAGRPHLDVALVAVARGCGDVVDIQFPPGSGDRAVLIDQGGKARWVDFQAGTTGVWLETPDVSGGWEQGLLGLAFHPKFAENGQLFLHWTTEKDGLTSQVVAFRADPKAPFATPPVKEHVVYEVKQPYGNHNGGGVAFGPDGLLYVGYGDGGAGGDPHGNGQNRATALGKMLRLDVDHEPPYRVPADNPFVGQPGTLPEIWALGLRNPWRYSWDDRGRLVVADVGQNRWEEVSIVTAGSNGGWNVREGNHCFSPETGCTTEGLLDPVWEYGREEGQSVTGGYVAHAPDVLKGRYVLGDFGSGRIWALTLPDAPDAGATAAAIGKFPMQLSTFGRDASGRVYVAAWKDGAVYRLDATEPGR